MKNKYYIMINGQKYYKTQNEIKKLIKELFESKGKPLSVYELEQTFRFYVYLIDNDIPVEAIRIRKRYGYNR